MTTTIITITTTTAMKMVRETLNAYDITGGIVGTCYAGETAYVYFIAHNDTISLTAAAYALAEEYGQDGVEFAKISGNRAIVIESGLIA